MEITLDKFGRILIPKAVRDELGLTTGTALRLDIAESEPGERKIVLRRADQKTALVRKGRALVFTGEPSTGAAKLDATETVRAARQARLEHLRKLDG